METPLSLEAENVSSMQGAPSPTLHLFMLQIDLPDAGCLGVSNTECSLPF